MSKLEQDLWRALDQSALIDVSTMSPRRGPPGSPTAVTFRLADSMPRRVVARWEREARTWLERDRAGDALIRARESYGARRRRYLEHRIDRWHDHLDAGHGRCLMKDPQVASVVADALLIFDGERYDVERFVIMPNHVHLIVQMRPSFRLRPQSEEWLRSTSRRINAMLGRRGALWHDDPVEHVVRCADRLARIEQRIEDDPIRAGLGEGEYLFWRSG
ncbi:MAG: hypothetical protein CMJ18_14895 [Phycisphaeraceae bacterium]|nr:hypothetical protein [Phycisphaeraceae bacterium]